MSAQEQGHFLQRPAGAAGEHVDGLLDLQGVAHMAAQGLFHAGNHRRHAPARQGADIHHGPGQLNGGIQGGHDGAAAGLHVQHDGLSAAGKFLAQNAADDEGQRIHGGGHVPKGVEPLVRRGQLGALAHHGATHGAHDGEEFLLRQRHLHAGDAFQLVHRAAGVPQAPAAHFQHLAAAGRNQWGQDQGGGVAHAAGGVLVHRHAPYVRRQHIAALGHGHGQIGGFPIGHAVEAYGHEQGGQLIIRQGPVRRPLNEEGDFLLRQCAAPFFRFDDGKDIHVRQTSVPFRSLPYYCITWTVYHTSFGT